MNKSNKKPDNNIWKWFMIIMEVIIIVLLVLILFAYSWSPSNRRSFNRVDRQDKFVLSALSEPETTIFYDLKEVSEDFFTSVMRIVSNKQTFEEIVASYVFDICQSYPNVDPYIVLSVIYHESRFTPNVSSGNCVGLMQVSTYWSGERALKLGVTDFYDAYSNILLGVDILNDQLEIANGDIYYALMLYNQTADSARQMYLQGIISGYAKSVVAKAEEYRGGYFYETA